MQIRSWEKRNYGFDGWWTAIQFDNAISYLGSWIESEVQDRVANDKQNAEDALRELINTDQHTIDHQIDNLALLTGGTVKR